MKLFVVGNPIKHSKSPIIHNLWLRKRNRRIVYEKKLLSEKQLRPMINMIRKGECLGFNITLPFKTKILKFLDHYEENVKQIGAANTVYLKENKIIGANTDGKGFVSSLKHEVKMNLNDKKVFVIGAGGASRGILLELLKYPVKEICICNRNLINAKKLKKILSFYSLNCKITLQRWQRKKILRKYDLVINTTSFGMNLRENLNFDFCALRKRTVVYDLIYNPKETNFLKSAKKSNLRSYNGVGMLVRQAAESFARWFNEEVSEKDINEVKRIILKK